MKFLSTMICLAAAQEKIQIEYFYESVCPLCKKTITETFQTAIATDGFTDMA